MTTTQITAKSLEGIQWIEDGKVASFQSGRLYGVTDGEGRWATFAGSRPGAWDRKATAAEIAAAITVADVVWIEEAR